MQTPVPEPALVALDEYSRVASSGWGSADVGGAYRLVSTAADYSVNGAAGMMRVPSASASRAATLPDVRAQDTDIVVRLQSNRAATGDGQFAYLVARQMNTTTEYRGQIRFDATGAVGLRVQRIVNGTTTAIGNEAIVSGLTHGTDTPFWVRFQAVGTNPTTLRLRAWADGEPEPTTWRVSVTNAEASLQGEGAVGVRSYLSSRTTNAPVTFTFDDFQVVDLTLAQP